MIIGTNFAHLDLADEPIKTIEIERVQTAKCGHEECNACEGHEGEWVTYNLNITLHAHDEDGNCIDEMVRLTLDVKQLAALTAVGSRSLLNHDGMALSHAIDVAEQSNHECALLYLDADGETDAD